MLSSENPKGESISCLSLCSWQFPVILGNLWFVEASFHHGVLPVSLVFLFIRTSDVGLGLTPLEYDL